MFDSVVDPAYAELSRTHVDAVLGDVIPPLAWTLMGPAFEHSQYSLWRRMGALGRRREDRYRFAIRADGRLHLNVTALRAMAARMVSASPADVDAELGLTPATVQAVTWRDRVWYPRTILGSAITFGTLNFALRRQQRRVRRAMLNDTDLESASAAALVARVEQLRRDDLAAVMVPHHAVRMVTKVALDRLHARCDDPQLANGLMADLPDLEATEPSRALLSLADDLRRSGRLDEVALAAFIDRFGHRGVNELDPTAPVWAQQQAKLVDLIGRMAAGPEIGDAASRGVAARVAADVAIAARGPTDRRRIRFLARLARRYAVLGERSKGELARYVHEIRRALSQLESQAAAAVPVGDLSLLSWDELKALVAGERSPSDEVLALRRAELMRARETPAEQGNLATTILHGIGASSGRVHGRAVVVVDPLEPLDDGDVLVAHATDTAWTPLFLTVRAVVTDTGQLMSHGSIVARDLGIPAVVGTGRATAVTATGVPIDVDGDRGVVVVG